MGENGGIFAGLKMLELGAGAAGPSGSDGVSCWDLNQNGDVDFADVLTVISNWGPCP